MSKWACMITPKLSSQVGQPTAEILRVTSHVEQSSTLDKQPWDFHLHVIYGDYIGKPTSRVLSTLHIGVLVDKQPQWFSTPHIGGYTDKQLYGFYTVHILEKKPYGFKITITEPNHAGQQDIITARDIEVTSINSYIAVFCLYLNNKYF